MEDQLLRIFEEMKAVRRDIKDILKRVVDMEHDQELGHMEGLADIDGPDLRRALRIGERSLYDLRQESVFNTYSFKPTEGAKPAKIYFLKSEVLASLKNGKL